MWMKGKTVETLTRGTEIANHLLTALEQELDNPEFRKTDEGRRLTLAYIGAGHIRQGKSPIEG